PWDSVPSKYAVGSTVKGSVTKLMQFGAFVRLEAGVEGLIHISEMGHGRVNKAGDVVSEGQEVEVKVLSVDTDAQRIGLSLKALMPTPDRPARESKQKDDDIPAAENLKRREKESDKNLKGGISSPSGGEQFGLKW
ncbi:MAG: S1 RNA-binding domain-containing protein, partial [Bythopirellula sp.]